MPRSVSHTMLEEFMERTGMKKTLEFFNNEELTFKVTEGAKKLIIESDGDLEESIRRAYELRGRQARHGDIRKPF